MAQISLTQIGGSALPHILEINSSKQGTVLIGVFNEGIELGDTIWPFNSEFNYEVKGVIESRKAKGDWSGASYKDKKPTYYKLDVAPIEKPKPQLSNTKA